jgi:hypothetical protein
MLRNITVCFLRLSARSTSSVAFVLGASVYEDQTKKQLQNHLDHLFAKFEVVSDIIAYNLRGRDACHSGRKRLTMLGG